MRMRDLHLDMFTKRGGASCMQVARTLQRYLDGDLDEPTRARVAGHLDVCRRCGLDAKAYRDIKTALAERGEDLPEEPMERLRAFAAELSSGNSPPRPDEQ
jgi:anti-sigma factor RsiW